ncbi:hypothetical protein F4561_005762 [Lipingzhangella halophila]|uniref:NADAR domain-containing protein n=1 Tax=Lipingzhangella halophila TaxID=1783352 RepID=A0A7W7RNQ6_9ACTN|nr:NADAR family protein [Lipingzhangella halophila]MBB4934868.1 hypothetical protein [Lipingzhangella halophila]
MVDAADIRDVSDFPHVTGRVKFLFFWGHRPPRSGGVGPGCLSQWWPSPFTADGIEYPTAEHYMMAEKARLFGDTDAEDAILSAGHPKEAKDAGRGVRGFDEAVWERERYWVVVRGNHARFAQHAQLRDYLLASGSRVLVEASPRDRIWGIGLAADDERAHHPDQWRGRNLLGFALMEVRSRLAD